MLKQTRSAFTPASMSTSLSVSSAPSSLKTWRTDELDETSLGCGSIAVSATFSSCFLSIWSNGVPGPVGTLVAYRCKVALMGLWELRDSFEGRLRRTVRLLVVVRAFNGRSVQLFRDEEVTGFKFDRARDRAAPLRSIVSIRAGVSFPRHCRQYQLASGVPCSFG